MDAGSPRKSGVPLRARSTADVTGAVTAGRPKPDVEEAPLTAAAEAPPTLAEILEDTPATATRLKKTVAATEASSALLGKALKKAAQLRETLHKADEQRAELLACVRGLSALYEGPSDELAVLRGEYAALCDSLEEANRVHALESFHLSTTFIEGLTPLTEQASSIKTSYKALAKRLSTVESLEDKLASQDRKELTSNAKDAAKNEELRAEWVEATVGYRKSLLDCEGCSLSLFSSLTAVAVAILAQRLTTERQHRLLRQMLDMWLAQRAQSKATEATYCDMDPFVANAVAHLEKQCAMRALPS